MASRVAWSRHALEDVEAIVEYIGRDSPAYAAAVVHRVLAATRRLERYPFSGRVVPGAEERAIREVFAYSYRVIYRIQVEVVTILAVVHTRRHLDPEDIPDDS